MTQYLDRVYEQRIRLEAEKWSNEIQSIHAHSLSSMWYDNRPQDTDGGSVVDTMYNDGRVERKILKTGETVLMNTEKRLRGEDLVYEYKRKNPTS